MVLDKGTILDAMHANTHFQMEYFPNSIPQWNLRKCPDVTTVQSPLSDDTFNYVINAQFSDTNASQRIQEVVASFQGKPFAWWTSKLDHPKNIADLLLQNGLRKKEVDVGMYCTDLSGSKPSATIQRVKTPQQLKAYFDVYTSIGGSPKAYPELFIYAPAEIYTDDAPLQLYLGTIDHLPILTGMLVLHANAAGIYYVMTHPDYRCRGFGTAMMQHLMHTAYQADYTLATLQASAEGKNLYEKLGFQTICEFVEYS